MKQAKQYYRKYSITNLSINLFSACASASQADGGSLVEAAFHEQLFLEHPQRDLGEGGLYRLYI